MKRSSPSCRALSADCSSAVRMRWRWSATLVTWPKCVRPSDCGFQHASVCSESSQASTSMSGGGVGAIV